MLKHLGPCEVWYNGSNLGNTSGSVTFKFTEESKPVNEDQSGVSNIDEIMVGVSACEVEVNLSIPSMAKLAIVIGGSSYTGSKVKARGQVGVSMYDNSKELILKAIVNNAASTDEKDWLTIPHAYPKVDLSLAFDADSKRVYKTIFKGFPDATTGDYFHIG